MSEGGPEMSFEGITRRRAQRMPWGAKGTSSGPAPSGVSSTSSSPRIPATHDTRGSPEAGNPSRVAFAPSAGQRIRGTSAISSSSSQDPAGFVRAPPSASAIRYKAIGRQRIVAGMGRAI